MTPELTKSQVAQEQLADLNQTLEKEKIQLTTEVEEYVRSHIRAVQDKLQAGEDVYERELEFIPKVKLWVMMPKEWRKKYKSVDDMVKSEEMKNVTISDVYEANKRHISLKQWMDLLHVMKAKCEEKEWIDETFKFPGGGKIRIDNNLDLRDCTSLTSLPEGLEVREYLFLSECTSLTSLPGGLKVVGSLSLSGCKSLTSLPKGLKVGRDLNLDGCTSLTSLPGGLKVGKHLFLENCTSLTSLPEGLKIGEDLWLSKDLNEQVKKDAERLKNEGKIKGEIKYE